MKSYCKGLVKGMRRSYRSTGGRLLCSAAQIKFDLLYKRPPCPQRGLPAASISRLLLSISIVYPLEFLSSPAPYQDLIAATMAEAKPKAEPKVPSFLWFQCGGRGPVPTITQFERMQKGDRSTYEKANAATDRVKAAKRRKSSSGWRSDLTLLNPLSARRLQMDYDRLKIVKGVEKGMTEEEKAEEEVKEEEKKEEVAEEEEKKEKPKYKEPEAQAPAGGEEQKEMEQKIRKMRRQMKTLRAALNKALDSKYESDEETSGDEGKTSGDESGGESSSQIMPRR